MILNFLGKCWSFWMQFSCHGCCHFCILTHRFCILTNVCFNFASFFPPSGPKTIATSWTKRGLKSPRKRRLRCNPRSTTRTRMWTILCRRVQILDIWVPVLRHCFRKPVSWFLPFFGCCCQIRMLCTTICTFVIHVHCALLCPDYQAVCFLFYSY